MCYIMKYPAAGGNLFRFRNKVTCVLAHDKLSSALIAISTA